MHLYIEVRLSRGLLTWGRSRRDLTETKKCWKQSKLNGRGIFSHHGAGCKTKSIEKLRMNAKI